MLFRSGLLDHERHIRAPLELVINIDQVMLKVDVADCQPAELRNTHAGMKQDIKFYFNGMEYEYDIDANTGAVLKAKKEWDD